MNHGFILIELLTALVIISFCLGAGINYLYTSHQHHQELYGRFTKHLEQVSSEEIRLKGFHLNKRGSR
ncbi:type II secretion system protein [Polynucleobacter rarus]|uniref:type II secretion system protein n=1 Tax=Polynucleobacter rarus TaxID=556055 RepID=UPI000D3E2BC5